MVLDIHQNTLKFFHRLLDDPHHRYRSWDHCYLYFQKAYGRKDDFELETAALQLAFYLASWGMYRGSSELLQKDYRVHISIIEEITTDAYLPLWNLDYDMMNQGRSEVSLFFHLMDRLRNLYANAQISPTDTLVTKVLLGTIACTPAYDSLLKDGIKAWSQFSNNEGFRIPARFGLNSYVGLIKFYQQHRQDFQEVQSEIVAQHGVCYPAMKLVDMYFWNLGYQRAGW